MDEDEEEDGDDMKYSGYGGRYLFVGVTIGGCTTRVGALLPRQINQIISLMSNTYGFHGTVILGWWPIKGAGGWKVWIHSREKLMNSGFGEPKLPPSPPTLT